MSFLLAFLRSQLLVTLPYPEKDFSGQTVIVTGSNTGLGLDAARHFARLNAAKVILAVRNLDKGEAARKTIEESIQKKGTVEVWPLDLSSYESVRQFAAKCQTLSRLDAVVENAGIATQHFTLSEGSESTVTTNVISTFLLALLLLPKLRDTATRYNTTPHLVIVSSDVQFFAAFSERHNHNIFDALNDRTKANMSDRYNVSKIMEVFVVRELADRISQSTKPAVVLNCLNPGLCHSELVREVDGVRGFFIRGLKALLARTTEAGSRTLVAAVEKGTETHGKYMSDCEVTDPAPMVLNEEGTRLQRQIWSELAQKLENIHPGILQNI
ncbi:MAG: hypothetical protein M1817_000046 [Caeruleum heppii]|nr:MAG: hypothetical protein M1817_000046 [Caeruleum heppii]